MSKSDFFKIGQIYSESLNQMKSKIKHNNKVKPGEIGEAPLIKGGPDDTEGYVKKVVDRRDSEDDSDNLYDIDVLSQPDYDTVKKDRSKTKKKKLTTESQKMAERSINNFMRKKSLFDRLYENVMTPGAPEMGGEMGEAEELDALGIDDEGDVDMAGEDEVTFTLDRATAQKLHDVLMSVLEGGEEDFGDEGDFDMEDENADDDFNADDFGDEDEEELGHTLVNAKQVDMGKNNKVGTLKVQSGGASSAYTDKVGNDGDYGHALVNAKQPNMGKSNKVGKLKVGGSLFEQ
jgi:hypothetical protein